MPSEDESLQATLSPEDVTMICEALDSYEYWELGDALPRNNGLVFLPGDLIGDDYFWEGRQPTEDEREAIDNVRTSRVLAARLAALLRAEGR